MLVDSPDPTRNRGGDWLTAPVGEIVELEVSEGYELAPDAGPLKPPWQPPGPKPALPM